MRIIEIDADTSFPVEGNIKLSAYCVNYYIL